MEKGYRTKWNICYSINVDAIQIIVNYFLNMKTKIMGQQNTSSTFKTHVILFCETTMNFLIINFRNYFIS